MSTRFSSTDFGNQLVAGYRSGDLTRKEFALKAGVRVTTLDYYLRRQRQAADEERNRNRLLPVEVVEGEGVSRGEASGDERSAISVLLAGGRRLEVGRGFDAELLIEVLHVLERG
jgi:hypothetical protein